MDTLLFNIDSTRLKDGGASGKAFDKAFQKIFSINPITVDKYGKTDSMIFQDTAQATLGRFLTPREDQQPRSRYEKELFEDSLIYIFEDSPFDMIAGNQNNAITIGVATGESPAEDLRAADAVAVVEDLNDTKGIIALSARLKARDAGRA